MEKLTKTQAEIVEYLREGLTIKQIASRRKTSLQAVYKQFNKLHEKGFIYRSVRNSQGTGSMPPPVLQLSKLYRVHGLEFNIKLIYSSKKYLKMRKQGKFIFEGDLIKMYNKSMEIYSSLSFYDKSLQKAYMKAIAYYNKLLSKLERRLHIIILKSGYLNIKLVKCHVSEIHNELARQYNINKKKLQLCTTKEGDLWGQIDNSFNLNEFETLHPDTHYKDMNKMSIYFNDIRDNFQSLLLPSQSKEAINKIIKNQVAMGKLMKRISKEYNQLHGLMTSKNKPLDPRDNYFG